MNRHGAIVQVMLILFFVFLVILGLTLLAIDRSKITDEEGAWRSSVAYADTQAMTALVGLLRQPMVADLDGDGKAESVTIGDAIAANKPAIDTAIKVAIRAGMPDDLAWQYTISTPDRTIEDKNDVISFYTNERTSAQSLMWNPCKSTDSSFDPKTGTGCLRTGNTPKSDVTGVANIPLPNGVTMTLLLSAIPGPHAEADE